METTQLFARARDGDAEAREALLERLRPRIVLWTSARLGRLLRAEVEPDDLAQDVLLAVHSRLDAFEGSDRRALLGWVFTIAENRIRDLADRAGAAKRQRTDLPRRDRTSPSQAAARAELARNLAAAVARLDEPHRQVIRMRRFEELEVPEIARRLDRSENAVRILYCRAIAALREAMKQEGRDSA
ncbi:MAG: sigma-70 family RNA polymerase sigma factor [Planctomycetes bacterium]|nr:sigma-70 family RNA polymerase sigma factor [Planctomycetota bacterium]